MNNLINLGRSFCDFLILSVAGVPVPEVPADGHAQGGSPARPCAGRQAKVQEGFSHLFY